MSFSNLDKYIKCLAINSALTNYHLTPRPKGCPSKGFMHSRIGIKVNRVYHRKVSKKNYRKMLKKKIQGIDVFLHCSDLIYIFWFKGLYATLGYAISGCLC